MAKFLSMTVQDRSLDLFTSGPACYQCTTDDPTTQIQKFLATELERYIVRIHNTGPGTTWANNNNNNNTIKAQQKLTM